MRILALETSSFSGSCAVADDDRVLSETFLPDAMRTAQGLAPMIERQLLAVGWTPKDIQLVAVTQGPGSFTGLRVGVTTAKTMAYALNAQVLGIDTLAVIAQQAPPEHTTIEAVLDAQRRQLFVARFCRDADGSLRRL